MTEEQTAAPTGADPKGLQILAAAREEFIRAGYAATSMDGVARRAKVSKTTLYTRFASKEALFAGTVAAECRRSGVDFRPEEFDGLPVDEALRRIGRRVLDLICSPDALRVQQMVVGELARFPEVGQTYLREGPDRVTAAVAGYLARANARGLLAVGDAHFAAGQFLAAIKGMCDCELLQCLGGDGRPQDREGFIARSVALFLDGARPRREAPTEGSDGHRWAGGFSSSSLPRGSS